MARGSDGGFASSPLMHCSPYRSLGYAYARPGDLSSMAARTDKTAHFFGLVLRMDNRTAAYICVVTIRIVRNEDYVAAKYIQQIGGVVIRKNTSLHNRTSKMESTLIRTLGVGVGGGREKGGQRTSCKGQIWSFCRPDWDSKQQQSFTDQPTC